MYGAILLRDRVVSLADGPARTPTIDRQPARAAAQA